MTTDASKIRTWPKGELGLALAALARIVCKEVPAATGGSMAEVTTDEIDAACAELGLECDEIALYAHQWETALRSSVPAVIALEDHGWAAITEIRGRHAHLLTPEMGIGKVALDVLREALCRRLTEPHRAEAERIVGQCGIAAARRPAAIAALLEARVQQQSVGVLYAITVPPSVSFIRQLCEAGVLR